MKRRRIAAGVAALVFAAALEFPRVAAATTATAQEHSLDSALAAFEIHPEVLVEAVAVEPAVVDPVAMQFDERGRIWVVEMGDYPGEAVDSSSAEDDEESLEHVVTRGVHGRSRIRLLEDLDRDGRYETAHTFADRIPFATGVQPWRDGVIVTLAGEVAFLRDTDGDLAADVRETWFEGFAEQNPQLRANDPTFAMDGWVYLATGLRGGTIRAVHPRFASAMEQGPVAIDRSGFRFNPQTGEAQAIAGESQFGIAVDAWGNRFVCDNRHPLQHVVLERRYLPPLAPLGWTKTVQDVLAAGENSRLFPRSRQQTTSYQHQGQFTAACGIHIHDGSGLPTHLAGNAFICEPTANLVHRAALKRSGASFQGTRGRPDVEFLTSTDSWFRPVFVTDGPDGALYVVDMCRAVIEHPDWMPELARRTDLRDGDDRGRIWRVRRRKPPLSEPLQPMPEDVDALIALLSSKNQWRRRTAGRLLLEDRGEDLSERLQALLRQRCSPLARAAAVQMLTAIDALPNSPQLFTQEQRPEVRRLIAIGWEANLVEAASQEAAATLDAMLRATRDGPAWLQLQVLLTAGFAKRSQVNQVFQEQAFQWSDRDDWQQAAMLSALAPFADDALLSFAQDVRQRAIGLTERQAVFSFRLARLAAAEADDSIARAIEWLSNTPSLLFEEGRITSLGRALFQGTAEGVARREGSFVRWLTLQSPNVQATWNSALTAEARVAADERETEDRRMAALDLLGFAEQASLREAVLDIAIHAAESLPLRTKAIDVLARRIKPHEADRLIDSLPRQSARLRGRILQVLVAQRSTALRLLDRIEIDASLAEDIPPSEQDRLRSHPIDDVRTRSVALLGPASDDDRSQVVASYLPALELQGSVAAGRKVFAERCASCHRVDGVGSQVGPDVADTYNKTREYLLTAILDPNRAIDGSYVAYTVVTTDGQTYSGLVRAETAATIELVLEEGKTLRIPREEIELLQPSRNSLMPYGLEKEINQQQMADLIEFLKGWRRE